MEMPRSSFLSFSDSLRSDSNSLRNCKCVSMYSFAASTVVLVPTRTTCFLALSMLSRVTLVLSWRSLKLRPPRPISQPICSVSTGTFSVTNSSSSRAASTLSCVGPMMETSGCEPDGEMLMKSTPDAFFASAKHLPPLPTTMPMSSRSIGNWTRWPVVSLSFSDCSLLASCSRSVCIRCMSFTCLPCRSTNILADAIAFSVPSILTCELRRSRVKDTRRDFAHTSCDSFASCCANHSSTWGSEMGKMCLVNAGFVFAAMVVHGRIRSLSSITSSPPAMPVKCTLMNSPLIDLITASNHVCGSASPSGKHLTSMTLPSAIAKYPQSAGASRTSCHCTQRCCATAALLPS
mmetsp:Transcript_38600/g.90253  ORF Transcript_38600/g.90253 Transcript_38600/m.90253 type:complete len:348 (-) Transcript_38600:225-1268(-)